MVTASSLRQICHEPPPQQSPFPKILVKRNTHYAQKKKKKTMYINVQVPLETHIGNPESLFVQRKGLYF